MNLPCLQSAQRELIQGAAALENTGKCHANGMGSSAKGCVCEWGAVGTSVTYLLPKAKLLTHTQPSLLSSMCCSHAHLASRQADQDGSHLTCRAQGAAARAKAPSARPYTQLGLTYVATHKSSTLLLITLLKHQLSHRISRYSQL
jgi:hypothetical protein